MKSISGLLVLLFLLPTAAFAGKPANECRFKKMSVTVAEGKGTLKISESRTEVVDKTSYTANNLQVIVRWEQLEDLPPPLTITHRKTGSSCTTKISGHYFTEELFFEDRSQIVAIREYIGSSGMLLFFDANSCELLAKTEASTGIVFADAGWKMSEDPSAMNSMAVFDPGYCKCKNRSNNCVGEDSYCYAGTAYKFKEDCVPVFSEVMTSKYNVSTYGVDFEGWKKISNARTVNAVLRK